ncbi:MAG TPA: protoglobin domain-containing protein [Chloroflexota bacterium]|nr:protoglobin domain-containing protein [Chloroflexota bacterium]
MASGAQAIPGYRYGDPTLAPSPVSLEEFERLKETVLFDETDTAALRRAGEILVPQADQILDHWYGFVGSHDFLLAYFSGPEGPRQEYLARVRARFGQWIADTCAARFDAAWLAYQEEIGHRHRDRKNLTDGPAAAGTPPFIHFRYVNALLYPIFATIRPFLEKGGDPPALVERMHQAWLKAVLLQVTLWARAYVEPGAW